MPSGMLYSDRRGWFSATLFWKNLTRFWPLLAVYTAVQFLALPVRVALIETGRGNLPGRVIDCVISGAATAPYFGFLFGLMAAMALFSYLMNPRAVGMFHALPLRREGLFFTNWLSGLSLFLFPNALAALTALVAEGVKGSLQPELTLRWFTLHVVIAMFFFCFAVCCAMFTGHILTLPVFYGVLNVLVLGVCFLGDNAIDTLLIGYDGNSMASSTLARWCTPVWHLARLISRGSAWWGDEYRYDLPSTLGALGYCVVLGAVFTLIAVLVYQHRQLERAGDVVTVSWARPIFQYGVGVCVGLTLGTILYGNFFDGFGSWAFVILVALCAVIGAFAARMLLKKTLRVFADGWKGCVVLGVCMLLLLGGAKADFLGYQRYVPDPARIKKVRVEGVDSTPYDSGTGSIWTEDPQFIQEVTELHAALVKELGTIEQESRRNWYEWTAEGYQTAARTSVRLVYEMENGKEVSRWYTTVPLTAQALAEPDSYAARLQRLINDPGVVEQLYRVDWEEETEATVVRGWLTSARGGSPSGELELTQSQAKALWSAVKEDLAAGRIHRYLLEDRDRAENCYYTDMVFDLNGTYYDEGSGKREITSWSVNVTVQKSATATIKTLKELGLEEKLRTREFDEKTEIYTEIAVD